MAKRVLKTDLSVSGINNLINEIENYKRELNAKCEYFTQRLAARGIAVAKQYASQNGYGNYLVFYHETDGSPELGYKTVLVASQTGFIRKEWQTQDGIREVDVSPLLMAEYGSGNFAVAGHQGTFPDQTHAFESAWHWKDLDGVWHSSSGTHPTQPVYHAWKEMAEVIFDVAKEVFGNG